MPVVFDFDGRDVGHRAVAALRRAAQSDVVSLTCRDTHFREAVELRGIVLSHLDAAGAVFEHGLAIADCGVSGSLDLTGIEASRVGLRSVRIGRSLFAQRATIATFFAQDLAVAGYLSFDQAEIKQLTIRDASFGEEARFRAIGWGCACTFARVAFSDEASFEGNHWAKLRFDTCIFAGTSDLRVGQVDGRFALLRSRMADLRRMEVDCWRCRLGRTTFEQPVIVELEAEVIDATGALFERGLDLGLRQGAELTLAGASLAGDSFIATSSAWSRRGTGPARVASLEGTRVERLTFRGLECRRCRAR